MTVSIRLKHSSVAAKVPLPADLADGELGLNIHDTTPAVYLKDSAGAVVQVGGQGTEPDATETVKGVLEIATQGEVTTGTDDTRAVTPLKLATAVPAATETVAGKAEIATQPEVTTGTDDTTIVTPLKLATAVPAASEATAGKAEIATQAEVDAGTDDTRIVTPLKLETVITARDAANDAKYVEKAGDTMTGDLTIPSLNGGQLAGFRNVLINGNLVVNQRGLDVAAVPAGDYGQDRWKATAGGMTQVVEDGNYIPGVDYTLSGTGVTTTTATSPATGDWDIASTHGDLPVTARLIQMERGTVATPFEHRPIGVEFALCQRYFQKNNSSWSGDTTVGTSYGNASNFATTMRVAPAMDSPTKLTAITLGNAPGFYGRAPSLITTESYLINAQCINNGNGCGYNDTWTADAEL